MEGQQRVGVLAEAPSVLRELGADPAALIAQAGVGADVLRNPENFLTFPQLGRFFQAAVAATKCPHFGLLVGQRSSTYSLGLVGRLMRTAPTLRDAILDLCRNQRRYVRGAVTYLLVRDGTAFWGYGVYYPDMPAKEQLCDGATAAGARFMQELAGQPAAEALLSRTRPADTGPYYRALRASLHFDAEQWVLAFPERLLDSKPPEADPVLRSLLRGQVANYWAVAQPDITERVMRALRARLLNSDVSLELVADDMRLHSRTLNRRLQTAGVTFRDLLNQARFQIAADLLSATRMEITAIGLALGYAEPSGFTNAFRRWSGAAPSRWRASA